MEEALSDPVDALVAIKHLAERCQAYGGERSVRLDAWRSVALMAQWGLDQEETPLRALIPMRAESALSVALQLRLAEQSGLVHGVAGGFGSASEPAVHIAISLAEVRSLKQWATSMAEVVYFLLPRCVQDDSDLVGVATRVREVLTAAEFIESLVVAFADNRVVPGRVRVDDLGCLASFRVETDGRRVRSGRFVEADVELRDGRTCWLNEVFGAGHPRAFRWTPPGDQEVFLGGASRLYRVDPSGVEVLIWGPD